MNRKTSTHQKLGFELPKNYFDTSKAQILGVIQAEKNNKTRVRKLIPKMITNISQNLQLLHCQLIN